MLWLRVLGILAVIVCIEKPATAQNQPWCIIKNYGDGYADCRYATLQLCLADRLGTGASCGLNSVPDLAGAAHEIAAAFLTIYPSFWTIKKEKRGHRV